MWKVTVWHTPISLDSIYEVQTHADNIYLCSWRGGEDWTNPIMTKAVCPPSSITMNKMASFIFIWHLTFISVVRASQNKTQGITRTNNKIAWVPTQINTNVCTCTHTCMGRRAPHTPTIAGNSRLVVVEVWLIALILQASPYCSRFL